jgi:ribosome-binding ATPase YchF (GTP1/OBG family)
MNNFFQKDRANNEEKINRIIEMLEAEAAYLRQLNEKLEKLSDEWQFIKKSMARHLNKDMQLNINNSDVDTEKDMEELIQCIVKEVNNYHIEFVCLN